MKARMAWAIVGLLGCNSEHRPLQTADVDPSEPAAVPITSPGTPAKSADSDATPAPSGPEPAGQDVQPTRCRVSGLGETIVSSIPDAGTLTDLFVDDRGVYFTEGKTTFSDDTDPPQALSSGTVMRSGLTGGIPSVLWSGASYAQSVAASPAAIYFIVANRGTVGGDAHTYRLDRGTLDAVAVASWSSHGTATALAPAPAGQMCWSFTTGTGGAVQCDDGSGAGAPLTTFPSAGLLAASTDSLLWVSVQDLLAVPAGGGVPVVRSNAPQMISGLAASPATSDAFFTVGGDIYRAASGATGPVQVSPAPSSITSIATDGRFLYWTESQSGSVNAVSVSGGEVVRVASGLAYPTKIVIFGSRVYWLDIVSKQVLTADGCLT